VIDRARLLEQAGDAVVAGHIGRDSFDAELAGHGVELLGAARRDDDLGAFLLRQLRSRETDAGRAADHDDLLA